MKKILPIVLIALFIACSGSDSDSSDDTPQDTCNTPTALSASNITETTTDISWSSNEATATFEIQYGLSGFSIGNGQSATSNNTSASLSGLSEGTNYQFYVRANCGSGMVSDWSNASNFTTDEDVVVTNCGQPTDLFATNFTNSQAEVFWNSSGDATSWEIEYGLAGFTQGTGTTVTTSNNGYTITGLQSETQYAYYVKSICGTTGESAFAGPHLFTTEADCRVPEGLGGGNQDFCSVDINWGSNGETAWEIEYGVSGFTLGTGTVINTSDTFYTIEDLDPGTTYEIYVRANCGSEGFSEYTDAYVVSTDALGYTGQYLLEQLSADGVFGAYLSTGTIVTVSATSGSGRTFDTETFPDFCPGTFSALNFNLACNTDVIMEQLVSNCACGGNYLFGPASVPASFDPTDDSELILTFTADVTNDCGDTEQVTYRLTKQ